MAGEAIDNALIIQFSEMVHVAAQQSRARLRGAVQIKPMRGDVFAYDGLGTVEASEIIGRHQPRDFADIDHLRRKISRRRFALTLPIDASDVRGALISPDSLYAGACVRAMDRVFDRLVIEAQFAPVLTGREFATSVSAATDGVQTIDATVALTYEKLLEMGQKFLDKEVGTDVPERLVFGITGEEHTALMKEIELVSGDFSRHYVVDKGRMTMAAGFELIHFAGAVTRPMLPVTAGVRDCFAMSSRAMCVGMSKEMAVEIQLRNDLYETTQVSVIYDLGAVRTEGVLMQKVQTTDA